MSLRIVSTHLSAAVIALALFGASVAFAAWAGPTAAPPGNNASAPVNVGTTAQVKNGSLSVNTFAVFGSSAINNTSPTLYLQDTDNRSSMIHNNGNLLYFLRGCGNASLSWCTIANGYWPLYLNLENNDAVFGGNVYAFGYFHNSDAKLKKNIETAKGLDIIAKLRGVTFDWKHDDSVSAGVIAQEIEEVLPAAVREDAQGTKSVDYDQLIAHLIEAVKEQQAEIDALKTEIERLK